MTSPARSALVLIDLQNEFLTATGFFKRPVQLAELLEPLRVLTHAAREAGHLIIWVKSHYPQRDTRPEPLRPQRPEDARFEGVPMNSDMLASGHSGRACCVEGSPGADYPAEIAALQHDTDAHLTKSRYSAFAETDLLERLHDQGVHELFLAGVVTNVCVRATATDAFFHGFDVTVVSDAVAATRANLHREGLKAIAKHYARVEPAVLALTRWGSVRRGLGSGDTQVWYGVLPEAWQSEAFERVREEVEWSQMRHRGGLVPRKVCLQGKFDAQGSSPMYRHPADEQPELQSLTPWINKLMAHCVELLEQPLNHVLIQHYLDGMGYISPHSDKTLDITRGSAIVGLSLGATRSIILQSKRRDEQGRLRTQVLELPHGSLFVLGWHTNQEFQHGIRQDKRAEHDMQAHELRDDTQRISLTMRSVATFLTPDGELFGQGALRKRLEDTPPDKEEVGDDFVEAERLLVAFGAENMQDDFDWDDVYGRGFDILDFAALRLAEEST